MNRYSLDLYYYEMSGAGQFVHQVRVHNSLRAYITILLYKRATSMSWAYPSDMRLHVITV